ncbi:MAG: hypothetical protein A2Z99_15355 [Treponema sp. GWB1_62_6]|nr:MAG: hypothetical protein A2Y36_04095 [Treponema sp. GWA1_62_8]OHE68116.1 MAG: hypothetical protein A2Z99_15355 [Treponema sp. GWB1_62_6]OHE68669.1 MAG: hypothetical protein A2001_06070 [Treponema sp. GWC1_61_84]HCM26622.1 hypothetical protein [Treponema sp.]
MNEDRRVEKRFSIKQFIDLSAKGEEFIHVRGLDLSLGGLSCETTSPLDPMMQVFVLLSIPGDSGERIVEVEGYVAHSRMEKGVCIAGISFIDRTPDARTAIESYLFAAGTDRTEAD